MTIINMFTHSILFCHFPLPSLFVSFCHVCRMSVSPVIFCFFFAIWQLRLHVGGCGIEPEHDPDDPLNKFSLLRKGWKLHTHGAQVT